MRINTNISAITAQRNLGTVGADFSKSVERLSSGFRINRAGDDAAGLSISEKLRGQVRGLNQGVRNAQDGISLIQTAEGALNETHSILQRMRELSVQASNDTLTTTDRESIGSELDALNTEVNRIAQTTQFNTKTLMSGTLNTALDVTSEVVEGELLGTSKVAVGDLDVSNAQAGVTYTFTSSAAGKLTLTNGTTGIAQTVDVAAMTTTGTSTQTLNFSQLGVKATLNGFDAAGTAAAIVTDLTAAANNTVVTNAAGGSLQLHIGANADQTMAVSIGDMQTTNADFGNAGGYTSLNAAVTAFTGGPTQAIAENMIESIDDAMALVSETRSSLGAYQNRLEHTISNLQVSSENLTASESRIRDVDMAAETVKFTKAQILQQAGTSVLAQANQAPNTVLSLLR